MKIPAKYRYEKLTDKELVEAIIKTPSDEGAAVYLIYEKYTHRFRRLYANIYKDMSWYDDCIGDLFAYLKGKNKDWKTFRTFEGHGSFTVWFSKVARNRFLDMKPYLIGKLKTPIPIDENEDGKKRNVLADLCEEEFERRQRRVLVLEAIGKLKDKTQKFVMLKTLQGYKSAEIAEMLKEKWQKEGYVKYDNKGNLVIPSAQYVDVCRQRAKVQLKLIIVEN